MVVERAVDVLGGVDIWVNNAARLFVRPVVETTDEEWHSRSNSPRRGSR